MLHMTLKAGQEMHLPSSFKDLLEGLCTFRKHSNHRIRVCEKYSWLVVEHLQPMRLFKFSLFASKGQKMSDCCIWLLSAKGLPENMKMNQQVDSFVTLVQ